MKIKATLLISFLLFFIFSNVRAQEFKLIKTLYNQHGTYNICFSPDGKFFAILNSEETLIYSLSDFKVVKTLSGPYLYNMCFSPYSNFFACVNNKNDQVSVYHLPTFQLIRTFASSPSSDGFKIRLVEFNKNEKFFEVTTEQITELYSLPDFELVKTFVDVDNVGFPERRRDYSQNGKYFAAISSRLVVEIYSLKDYKLIEGLQFPSETISSLFFSPDGKFLAVQTQDLEPDEPIGTIPKIKARKVKFYSMPEIKLVKTLFDNSGVASSKFSPDSKFFVSVAHTESIVKIYSIPEFKLFKAITDHSDFVRAIAFSENGQYFASAGQDKKVNIYRVRFTF